ncbi:MAG TPA: c-type cytochrome [Pirellulaceae bacterium]|nr:c-type cytochrome [Pirellulaceae bacterium]
MRKPKSTTVALSLALAAILSAIGSADELASYAVPDAALRLAMVDRSAKESFLSVRVDTEGRLFVGSREAVFAYDPDGKGGYRPAVELYRFPSHSWIYDIAVRGNDLYVQTTTTTYLLPQARIKRKEISVKPLLWGLPSGSVGAPSWGVHQGMHGLAWGPEGDLYISFGDMLWYYGDFKRPDHWGHWYLYTADGAKFTYNGQGGILRMRPGGSRVQIVATGLRNPCGLAFDNQWNLFSHDNDHESMPAEYIPGRLLHVTQGADFAWPRGWMVTKMPDRKDLLRTMYGGMGRTVPVAQSYYDEPLLPAKYRDNILLARWGQRTVAAYPKWPSGATFRARERVLISCKGKARPVGVAVGPRGRIFAAVCYMQANEQSPIYRSDLIVLSTKEKAGNVTPLVDLVNADVKTLHTHLSNASWQLRQATHVELRRRGGEALRPATQSLQAIHVDQDIKDVHLRQQQIYLAAASKSDAALGALKKLRRHSHAQVRRHTIRALAEHAGTRAPRSLFVESLQDGSAAVQLAALQALFYFDELPPEVIKGPARSNDTYLRQTATRLMAEKLSADELSKLLKSPDARIRLAAVLALGRQLTVPAMNFVPPKQLTLSKTYSPRIYLDRKVVDLSKQARIGLYTIAGYWKVASGSHQHHFDLLTDSLGDKNESVRLQAAHFLSLLKDGRSEPAIKKVRTKATEGRLVSAKPTPVKQIWMCGPFPDLKPSRQDRHNLDRRHPPEKGTVDVTATYGDGPSQVRWTKLSAKNGIYSSNLKRRDFPYSFYATFAIESPAEQRLWLELVADGDAIVFQNGRSVGRITRRGGDKSTDGRVALDLTPGTNQILVRSQPGDRRMFALRVRALDRIALSVPEPENMSLAQRLKAATEGESPVKLDDFLKVDWKVAATEGNIANGRKLFASIGCAKCHAVTGSVAVTGGPSLADVGRRFSTDYLVESVLLPSKKVSAFFRSSTLVTDDGNALTGLITAETETDVELMLPDAKRVRVKKSDIEERKDSPVSSMPQGLVKSPDELKDLLSYLLKEQ